MTETISNSENPEISLRKYQEEGLEFLLSHRRSVLALDPGTGKTPTALVALRDAGARRTLIVAPKSVVHHWEDMALTWWPELWTWIGTGTAKQRTLAREDAALISTAPQALVINYEAMRQDIDALSKINWDAVVFDEAHRLKNRNAQQTRAANHICKHPHQWVWLVTGTPILNRPEEIWSLLHLIDRARFSSYWNWVRNYYETSMESYGWGPQRRAVEQLGDLRDGAVDRMRETLADVMFSRTLEQCLPDLPEVTHITIDVELDPEERRLYDDLKRKTWAEISPGEILLIPNDVARQTRLRQVVSNIEIFGAERSKPGSKIAAALEIISDLEPEQVVVLTWSRAAAERIAEECDGAFIHGGVDGKVRHEILEKFKNGEIRILTGTLATLGEGVDGLQVARHMIRLDRDWTPARNDQAVARLRRSGQRSAVVVHDIVAHDTIDATVEKALRRKENVIEAVLKDLS